jgi:hypothetical protein
MNVERGGPTLVELLVVTLLLALAIGATYDRLAMDGDTYHANQAMENVQETLRDGLELLETELREASTGAASAGADIRVAAEDSLVLRAMRKLAFVCDVSPGDRRVTMASRVPIAPGDSLLLFADGDSLSWRDDTWVASVASDARPADPEACADRFADMTVQTVEVPPDRDLAGLRRYAPVRTYEWVTYALRRDGADGWSLVRTTAGMDREVVLLGGLARPGRGLRFEYFDADARATVSGSQVAWVRVAVHPAGVDPVGTQEGTVTTTLFLRNS